MARRGPPERGSQFAQMGHDIREAILGAFTVSGVQAAVTTSVARGLRRVGVCVCVCVCMRGGYRCLRRSTADIDCTMCIGVGSTTRWGARTCAKVTRRLPPAFRLPPSPLQVIQKEVSTRSLHSPVVARGSRRARANNLSTMAR